MKTEIFGFSNPTDDFIKVKHNGKIYTPDYLVELILDQGHYTIGNINKKHVIDNSCGDGQFMIQVVNRYCKDFLMFSSDKSQLKKELQMYIHAIELEKDELEICKSRCDKVALIYGIKDVKWDFICADALKNKRFFNKMDYVVGNPPYVRVHNLNEDLNSVKEYEFSQQGMTDLFIVFYEIGIKMLNKTGILCYITPSSFFTSVAGSKMREYFVKNRLLESLCDLKHFQPFNATTYTTIVCLNKGHLSDSVRYFEFNSKEVTPYFVDVLEISDYYFNGAFYFSTHKNIQLLKKILMCKKKTDIQVKNGYATLADKVFICDFPFESKYIIPVLKASTGKWTKIFFPYDHNSKLISEEKLSEDKQIYKYICAKKSKLRKRTNQSDCWYGFGRSQAIADTFNDKLAVNTIIRTSKDLKLINVPKNSGIYSGLYIVSDSISYNKIEQALRNKEFGDYIALLAKYKSGGYYTFSSKDVKAYLDYKLGS